MTEAEEWVVGKQMTELGCNNAKNDDMREKLWQFGGGVPEMKINSVKDKSSW